MAYADSHVFTADYPFVNVDDTLVLAFDAHGTAARPRLFLTAAESDTIVKLQSRNDFDVTASPPFSTTLNLTAFGQQAATDLPVGGAPTTQTVSAITLTRGRLSVHIASPVPFRSYLRQPMINAPANIP